MADTPARYTATGKKIRRTLLGRKLGMTQVFDENGNWVPVTVLEVGPCTVLQVKTIEKDGYAAVQIGFGKRRKVRKPQAGLYSKLGLEPPRWVREVPVVDAEAIISGGAGSGDGAGEQAGEVKPGARVGLKWFADVKRVDVRGISKGRGFSGVIRRHHFNAGPKSHGTKNIREPGSTGMHTEPGRVLKGKRMPGHLGAVPAKARNLK
ncbi:MAG: 50S ribosomal protein L3, partial [Anaerolineales bacterium]